MSHRIVLCCWLAGSLLTFPFLQEATAASPSVTRLAYRLRLGSPRLQRLAGWQIREHRMEQAVPYILGLLRMKEPQRRRGALLALARVPVSWTAPMIRKALSDPVPEVRLAALEAVVLRKLVLPSKTLTALLQATSRKKAMLALQAITVTKPAGARSLLKGLSPASARRLGLALSLTLASLGDSAAQKEWFRWLRTRKGRELLARWPGVWAGKQLASRGLGRPSPAIRRLYARLLLKRPTAARIRRLQVACRQRKLGASTCRQVRLWAKRLLTPFPTMPEPFFLMSRSEVKARLQAIHREHKTRHARLQAVTRSMWGMPYKLDALGEGKRGRIDRDPTFSLQHLDCVTYLEESFALASRATLPKAIAYTQKLRYLGGVISYRTRKHLPMAQWIPSLTKMGWLKDVTAEVGGAATQRIVKKIDRRSYSTRTGQRFLRRLGRRNIVRGRFVLPYLKTADAFAAVRRIPPMTLLNVMRAPNPWSPAQIGHVGLVVKVRGQLYFRHASRVWQSVVDTPLVAYLSRLRKYKRSAWAINLLRIPAR